MRAFDHLTEIFGAALTRVDPYRMIVDHLRLEGGRRLVVAFDGERHDINLGDFDRILVLGAGKASARMARAVEDVLGDAISSGLIVTKYGHAEPLKRISVIEAGHPTPDANSIEAARRIGALAREADERTLILNLVSGGGSALLCAPAELAEQGLVLTLEDKQAVTRALLACGADINEINCMRKHLSGIKGGRLLRMMAPARSLNLILSDVVGDRLDTIASGLTAADSSTYAQALATLDKYRIADKIPAAARKILDLGAAGEIAETPKPGEAALGHATNILIGTNRAALLAARDKGRALGYQTLSLSASMTGEAREIAKLLFGIARDVRESDMAVSRPALVLVGGETTVTLTGEGKGGRNQEMALAVLAEMARDPKAGRNIYFLAASTDGSDGPTDAAGAFASAEVLKAAEAKELSIGAYLAASDSYHFFEATGHLLKTGPTMTNVCDLALAIVT